eukprot:TRINITY_DN4886_c0_g1_i2.p1 TRINITY_DN4886_c0_g1~~TRINITY_DN4886_c0_g1_i2.p1  ORF type:complete len:533 (-),score=148.66 TRINITY_DN4886_c0_g1_i2:40-1638(-)
MKIWSFCFFVWFFAQVVCLPDISSSQTTSKIFKDVNGEEVLIQIQFNNPKEREELRGFNIEKVAGGSLLSYLSHPNQLEFLRAKNFSFQRVPNKSYQEIQKFHKRQETEKEFEFPLSHLEEQEEGDEGDEGDEESRGTERRRGRGRGRARRRGRGGDRRGDCGRPPTKNDFSNYHDYNKLTSFLKKINCMFPYITRLTSIGKSVQGRNLWVIEITNFNSNEDEEERQLRPKFKYVGNMHGNEVVGRELLLRLLWSLVSGYGSSREVTRFVDRTHIFLLPSMNPGGFELATRGNAKGIDLNRNFPDRIKGWDRNGAQPETLAVMEWLGSHDFVLSANFHEGAQVVNYPFDSALDQFTTEEAPTPDDETFKWLSLSYAKNNPAMTASPMYPNGITNGARWYVVYGGMQDYNYLWTNCMEITIELTETKFPPADNLPTLWKENKWALWEFMQRVHRGIKGKVTDVRGRPLVAQISIKGISRYVFSDASTGTYFRLLVPGKRYTVVAQAKGKVTQTKTINVPKHKAVVVNFELEDE